MRLVLGLANLKRRISDNAVNAVTVGLLVLAGVFLLVFISYGGIHDDLNGLWLVGIEIFTSAAVALFIVERAVEIERRGVQSRFALLDRSFLYDSLAKLVFIAYIRLLKGVTNDIGVTSALVKIDDPLLWDLYIFGGMWVGSDKIFSLIKEMERFSALDFVLGIDVDETTRSLSLQERSAMIAGRFNAYGQDSIVIRRDLPALIDRSIQTSANEDEAELFYRIKELVAEHEEAIVIPLKIESDAAQRYRDISDSLTRIIEEFAHIKLYNYPNRDKRP